ncbi:MAG: HD domain-containing protein [Patescibacteria group bacterium]
MRDIFLPHGEFGAECYALWLEYEDGTSEGARVLADLDKLECAMQGVCYAEQGHTSRPEEFNAFTRSNITHPGLLEMLAALEERTRST